MFTKRLSAMLALLLSPESQAQQASKLKFTAQAPTAPIAIFGNAWTIYAEGNIDPDAGSRLSALIAQKHIPPKSILVLDSKGGSLLGGMDLGRVIRDAGFFTYVGRENSNQRYSFKPGECYSSCTLAFLGGKYRWIVDGSIFGVHRFYTTKAPDNAVDLAQITSAAIIQYVVGMDVDPKMFVTMTTAGRDEIRNLTKAELVSLNVVNNGEQKTHWTIESVGTLLYLKGERETYHGLNKLIFSCVNRRIHLYAIFDPEGRGNEVIEMPSWSVFVDERAIPLPNPGIPPKLINGLINVDFELTDEIVKAVPKARSVGVAAQYAYDAPSFLGFSNMSFVEGKQKYYGLLSNCGS